MDVRAAGPSSACVEGQLHRGAGEHRIACPGVRVAKPVPSSGIKRPAQLRLPIGGRVWRVPARSSDGGGEFGERCGDARAARGVDAEFVVSAAETSHAVDLSSCGPLFFGLGGRERGGFVVALTGL